MTYCCFPGECCMPGPHEPSECHTPEMIEAYEQEEERTMEETVTVEIPVSLARNYAKNPGADPRVKAVLRQRFREALQEYDRRPARKDKVPMRGESEFATDPKIMTSEPRPVLDGSAMIERTPSARPGGLTTRVRNQLPGDTVADLPTVTPRHSPSSFPTEAVADEPTEDDDTP